MSSQPANLRSFTALVKRLFHSNFKPNQKASADLYADCCSRERNFAKRFNNDQAGSSTLVKQIVLRNQPHLSLRGDITNTQGKATSASAGLWGRTQPANLTKTFSPCTYSV